VFENDRQKFVESYLNVNFKTAGAVLKGDVQKLKTALSDADKTQMGKLVEMYNSGKVEFAPFGTLDANLFVLCNKPKPDFLIATENDVTLVLDITIDEHLMIEGLYRELTRQIQLCRRQANYNVEDRIYAELQTQGKTLQRVIDEYAPKIKQEALILEIEPIQNQDFAQQFEIGEETVLIKLKK
jgi:isoleucyl-tRNA synthetase